ncbi:hypothetical protein L228DRAFT_283960 [Xylona heveae TC161]|uniref:Uncharacterized protein n=1 Tax=Xylona heveae (strain CBS 132557 / TC161) TaxID=1328760 RepID=A0A165G7K4_XYLHT|nr:hypothetical protein L228DRAFT_283960 [Xylona heveae TC161]KZF21832.1 hypothetical protein L228DRAFT_283960 [Xylona heveae TC161]
MGIQGLLPLLKSIQRPSHLKRFAGQTLGVDAYGWLHRGTIACAIDLALGKPTTRYIDFALNRVRMLIHFGVTPYLVFDGDYLPSKAATESGRAARREESRKAGLELLKTGKIQQAQIELQKAIDVTPEMARVLIDALKRMKVKYVVAPYEADAQMAYLERKGFIQGIISEDSDLLVFGAKCLLTKLDQYGECIEINRSRFTACREISLVGWTDADFRRMAILSGCDYLASINKMGLKTSYRLIRKYKFVERLLRIIQFDGQFRVPQGYLEDFRKAELTFCHQRVFCPEAKALVMCNPSEEQLVGAKFDFLGVDYSPEIAQGVARGDLHPMTKENIVIPQALDPIPRTPVALAQGTMASSFSDLKGNKPIDGYFRPRRMPLQELDPNLFTPSPTQQRVLETNSHQSWTSRSAPARSTSATTIEDLAPSPAIAPASAPSTIDRARLRLSARRATSGSLGGSRLCTDSETPITSQSTRSRFFADAVDDPTPSAHEARARKRKGIDVNIWSDDSVEGIMADLPDVSDCPSPSKKGKMDVFQEGKHEDFVPESPEPISAKSVSEESQATFSESSQFTNGSKNNTPPSSLESNVPSKDVASILDKNVRAELQELKDRFAFRPSENTNVFSLGGKKGLKNTVPGQSARTPLQTRTPLKKESSDYSKMISPRKSEMLSFSGQKGVLRRAQTSLEDVLKGLAGNEGDHKAPSMSAHKKNHNEDKVAHPVSLPLKGSEDMMVPDSDGEEDYESSGVNNTETEEHKPVLDLGKFVFAPK